MFEGNIFYLIEHGAVSQVFLSKTDADMIKILFFLVLLGAGCFSFVPENHKNWKLLPHDTCGQVSTKRIIGGKIANLNAYPWIARIGYGMKNIDVNFFLCGGTLVNPNTVLTAAHCTKNAGFEAKVIRLGEHNVKTNPDCEGNYCADPVLDIPVTSVIVHRNYQPKHFKNDIAIMKLKEKVKFSASVRPICLGGTDFMKKDFVGTTSEVAGWGIYDITQGGLSDILQYVKLPVMDHRKCAKHYRRYLMNYTQFCAGGKVGEDSCSGDSGGPLMTVSDGPVGPSYYLLGIVSYGPTKCGASSMPGVYTNVTHYMEWILDNLNESSDSQ